MSNDGHCLPELGHNLTMENVKTKLNMIRTRARIEIHQDVDNADQKVKRFLKVHKTYKLLWEVSRSYLKNFSILTPSPLKMKV